MERFRLKIQPKSDGIATLILTESDFFEANYSCVSSTKDITSPTGTYRIIYNEKRLFIDETA